MLFLLPQVCQMPTANLSALICATMNSVPIGRAWQMIAVDILEVLVSMQKQQPLINGGAKLLDKAVSRSHSPSKSKQLFTSQRNWWGCVLHLALAIRDCAFRPGKGI